MGTIAHSGFRLTVIAPETDPRSYDFDEDRVSIGRAEDATLGIEHAAISRHQFTIIRRTSGSNGKDKDKDVVFELEAEPRATNATQVKGRLLLPQRLSHGDVIVVGPVEFRFEQKGKRAKSDGSSKKVRMAAGLLLLAILSMYAFFPQSSKSPSPSTRQQLVLFRPQPDPTCPESRICRQRAQEAYLLGQSHETRGEASPADLYRAAVQYQRALGYLTVGGFAKESIPDLVAREAQARERYTAQVSDGLFRMRQAASRGDEEAQRQLLEAVIAMIPDADHPLRRELELALVALPQPKRSR